jgi:hypothetical protein
MNCVATYAFGLNLYFYEVYVLCMKVCSFNVTKHGYVNKTSKNKNMKICKI